MCPELMPCSSATNHQAPGLEGTGDRTLMKAEAFKEMMVTIVVCGSRIL